ncbi:MAG: diguanylate cyclase [Desulfuromonadales bacterium]|nr:diguanylate cyclase [Desulfuromonadales bacterium]
MKKMRLSISGSIIGSYVLALAGVISASLVTLAALDLAIGELAGNPVALAVLRHAQLAVLILALISLVGGLTCMLASARRAALILERLREAIRHLADAVLDEELPDNIAAGVDLEDEIRSMVGKVKQSQRLYLDASPLTRLPGNIAIEQVLNERMAQGENFALCYIDLDDFKAYNDTYGYAMGSELIKMTGEIIHQAKDEHASFHDFVGHIGGDDFVLVTSPEQVARVCEAIIACFDAKIPDYYSDDDRARGYIECNDRYGVMRRFPLMTLSIAVVSDVQRSFSSPLEIAQVASEIKDYVKSLPGSNYLIDRRAFGRPGDD